HLIGGGDRHPDRPPPPPAARHAQAGPPGGGGFEGGHFHPPPFRVPERPPPAPGAPPPPGGIGPAAPSPAGPGAGPRRDDRRRAGLAPINSDDITHYSPLPRLKSCGSVPRDASGFLPNRVAFPLLHLNFDPDAAARSAPERRAVPARTGVLLHIGRAFP